MEQPLHFNSLSYIKASADLVEMTLFCRETLFCEVCFSPEEKELCLTRWCQPTAAVCLQGARMGRNGGAELEPQSAVLIFLWGAEMKPQLPEKMAQPVSKEKVGNQGLIQWASFCSDGTACFPLILLLTSCPMLSGPGTQLPINDVSHNPVLFADAWGFPWGCKAQHREWEVTSHWFGSSLQPKDSICAGPLRALCLVPSVLGIQVMKKSNITVTFPCIETGMQNFHHRVKKFTHIEVGWKKKHSGWCRTRAETDTASPLNTSVGGCGPPPEGWETTGEQRLLQRPVKEPNFLSFRNLTLSIPSSWVCLRVRNGRRFW